MGDGKKKKHNDGNKSQSANDNKNVFTSWFDWLVKTIEKYFGFTISGADSQDSFVRQSLLVVVVPALLVLIRAVNWGYLYLHYSGIYRVPATFLAQSDSLLVSLAVGLLGFGIIFAIVAVVLQHWAPSGMKELGRDCVIFIVVFVIIFFGGNCFINLLTPKLSDGEIAILREILLEVLLALIAVLQLTLNIVDQYVPPLLIISAVIIEGYYAFKYIRNYKEAQKGIKRIKRIRRETKRGKKKSTKVMKKRCANSALKSLFIFLLVLLELASITILIGRKNITNIFLNIQDEIGTTFIYIVLLAFEVIFCFQLALLKDQAEKNSWPWATWTMIAQIILVMVLAVAVFFRCDDYYTRTTPYAIVRDSQEEEMQAGEVEYVQVIVYQNGDTNVLEEAVIEKLADDGYNLTINTSQQQIVDNATLSYEYQSFDTVTIIDTSNDNQNTADDSSTSDSAETSTSADTSTDPADGAVSYDTSN